MNRPIYIPGDDITVYLTFGFDRYVDGEIVREGPVGDQGDGAYSAGVSFFSRNKIYICV